MSEIDDDLRDWIGSFNERALLADGFEDAIIGVAERCSQPALVVYDADKCVQILHERGMSASEAEEYLQFNTIGAWHGEHTPLFLWRDPDRTEKVDPVAMALNALEGKIDQFHEEFEQRMLMITDVLKVILRVIEKATGKPLRSKD